MELKNYIKPVDLEAMLQESVAAFMKKVKAYLKAWGDPDDICAGGDKKAFLNFLKEVQSDEAGLAAFAGKILVDDIAGNLRDLLSVVYGIGSVEVRAYDTYRGFDDKLDPAESGKGYKDQRLSDWVGIGDGHTSSEICDPGAPAAAKRPKPAVDDDSKAPKQK